MKNIITVLSVLVALNGCLARYTPVKECVSGKYPPSSSRKLPTYVVNLDLPPDQRWNQIVKNRGKDIANLLGQFKKFLLLFGNASKIVIKLVDEDMGYLADTFPSPYKEEIQGIAKASGLPLGEVVLYNIFYEVFTVCTSIVAHDEKGKMYHARNLDFGLFMGWNPKNHSWVITETLKNMIVNLDFQKNGKTVFKSVNFLGYIGILTAVKPGIFTFTMNERFNIDGGYIGIFKWILGDRHSKWMGFLTRDVLEYSTSYEHAKTKLSNSPMLAPAYFILGSNKTGQACVITRSRAGAVDTWQMNETSEKWYILETNYDHWSKPFFLDDRRTPAHACMAKITSKGVSLAGLFNVLSSRPVLNKLTAYTALMQVESGSVETYTQDCPDPCYPW